MKTFEVGKHVVKLFQTDRRWHADVDGANLPNWFLTEAEAWSSAVREALRQDQAPVGQLHG